MNSFLRHGRIRLRPALLCGENNLPPGAYDPSELTISQTIDSIKDNVKITVYDSTRKICKGNITPLSHIKETTSISTDYYMYCLALHFDKQLYEAFKADTCVHIKNPQIFIDRFFKALDKKLPNWSNFAKEITYIDESRYSLNKADVCFCKKESEKYIRQKEFRFVCLPENKIKKLDFLFVEIGAITDIAEMLYEN